MLAQYLPYLNSARRFELSLPFSHVRLITPGDTTRFATAFLFKLVTMVLAALEQGRDILQARIATTEANCGSQYSWMDNTQSQSPCYLASLLSAPCTGGGEYSESASSIIFNILTL